MAKTSSVGTKLKRYNGSSYNTIGLVTNISGPEQTLNMIDSTHLASTSNFREFIAGYLDGGEMSVELQLDPEAADASNQLLVKGDIEGRTSQIYRIVLASGPYVEMTCFVSSWHPFQIPEEDVVGLSFSLKVTGALTYADAE